MNSEPIFQALADATRQRILQLLVQQELNVSDLVEVLAQPQSTVSRHLKVLRDAGLIVDRREGASMVYAAAASSANGDGRDGGIRERIVAWVEEQPLPLVVAKRLAAVTRRRQAQSEAFFERVGHRWDQMRVDCFGTAFPYEALTALLPPTWTVADVGTGTGYLLPLLSRRFTRVIAVDPVPVMLEAARSQPGLAGATNVEFRAGDLSGLPMADGEADLALAKLVLHHVPSPAAALRELRRVLRPGGRVLIVEQAAHQCQDFFEQMQDRWWGFDPDHLAGELARAGFAEVRHAPLASAEPTSATAPEAPALFVMTADRREDDRAERKAG